VGTPLLRWQRFLWGVNLLSDFSRRMALSSGPTKIGSSHGLNRLGIRESVFHGSSVDHHSRQQRLEGTVSVLSLRTMSYAAVFLDANIGCSCGAQYVIAAGAASQGFRTLLGQRQRELSDGLWF